jgi:hypothetical protein
MSFWKYCEKVSGFIGMDETIKHIDNVYIFYLNYKTVEECYLFIKTLEL